MSYDWLTYERLDRVYRIDADTFASLVEDGSIEFISETLDDGTLHKFSKIHVAKHFSLRDRGTLLRNFASREVAVAAIAAATGYAISEAESYLDGEGQADDPAGPQPGGTSGQDAAPEVAIPRSVKLSIPVRHVSKVAHFVDVEFGGNRQRCFNNYVGFGCGKFDSGLEFAAEIGALWGAHTYEFDCKLEEITRELVARTATKLGVFDDPDMMVSAMFLKGIADVITAAD